MLYFSGIFEQSNENNKLKRKGQANLPELQNNTNGC